LGENNEFIPEFAEIWNQATNKPIEDIKEKKHDKHNTPKKKKKKPKIALNEDQKKALIDLAYENKFQHGVLLDVAFESGLRINELRNLIVSNFISSKGWINVIKRTKGLHHESFIPKTVSSERTIEIFKRKTVSNLKQLIDGKKNGYIFTTYMSKLQYKQYGSVRSMINIINKYAKECELIRKPIGFHTTRRTYASLLMAKGINIYDISKLLGHSSLQVTFRYLKETRAVDFNSIRNQLKGK